MKTSTTKLLNARYAKGVSYGESIEVTNYE